MRHACFAATVTHVDPGDKVMFANRDGITHNVVGLGNRWGDFERMGGGDSRLFTLEESGIVPTRARFTRAWSGRWWAASSSVRADAASVKAASLAKPGAPEAPATSETRTSASGGDWMPPAATAFLVAVVLAGLVLVARRRLAA